MKCCKTLYKAQTASYLKEIIASRMQFLGLQKWCGANDFLLHQAKTYFLENLQSERFLAVLWKHITVKFVYSYIMDILYNGYLQQRTLFQGTGRITIKLSQRMSIQRTRLLRTFVIADTFFERHVNIFGKIYLLIVDTLWL